MRTNQTPFRIGEYKVLTNYPLHWHDSFEIGYCLEGKGITVVEGREYSFGPGQVHVMSNIHRHMDYAEGHSYMFNVHFLPEILTAPGFYELENTARRPFVAGLQHFVPVLQMGDPHTEEVLELLKTIANEQSAARPGWTAVVQGLILQLTGLLTRHFLIPEQEDPKIRRREELLARLAPALQLIDERQADPPSLNELAAKVALSPVHFRALFREAVGSSPISYRNSQRIVEARYLLAESTLSIAEIAHQCGFATLQHFNQVFRRLVFCTPSEYRRQNR